VPVAPAFQTTEERNRKLSQLQNAMLHKVLKTAKEVVKEKK
jgi:hypothetical protein